MNKLLSIIIPSYNMEPYLRKCLTSICVDDRNLFEMLEVLVVNDGSTDGTSAIAHEFAQTHPSVFRVIDKPNGHYGSCINRGLSEARGTFVKILDADDSLDTRGFSRFLSDLNTLSQQKNPIDLVLSDSVFVNETDQVLEEFHLSLPPESDCTLDDITAMTVLPAMPAFTYRRAIFNDLNYQQTEGIAYTDTEWLFLPMTRVQRVQYRPYIVYRYLKGRADQSTGLSSSIKQVGMMRQTLDVKVRQYKQQYTKWNPSAQRYADRALSSELGGLYLLYLQCGFWKCRNEFSTLDALINSDLAHLKGQIGNGIYLSFGPSIRIRYICHCVKQPFARPFWSAALKLKQILASRFTR